MINFNGELLSADAQYLNHENRGLRYGDALFETLRVVNGKLFFWEDHYLRLIASMRILRMEIPMEFTMEFLEEEILKTITANSFENSPARLRFTVFRNNGGVYMPSTRTISYTMECSVLSSPFYMLSQEAYEVELFKDFYVNPDMLSTLKTNNKVINVVGSIFANENGYDNCILINNAKQVVEVLNGNIKTEGYTIEEKTISPFDLQKADELFITNSIVGIQSITKYRKKNFTNKVAKDFIGKLNAAARLG